MFTVTSLLSSSNYNSKINVVEMWTMWYVAVTLLIAILYYPVINYTLYYFFELVYR